MLNGLLFCAPPQDKAENGSEYKAWQQRYRDALRKRLIEEGFTEDEISDIIWDSCTGIKGIIKNLWRLYKALRAFDKAGEDVDPKPPRDK